MKHVILSVGCLGLFSGCLEERVAGSSLQSVLFVIDNSCSMTNEAEALGLNFGPLVDRLSAERLLDYQLAITTTSVAGSAQGAAGSLVTTNGVDIIRKRDDNVERQFNKNQTSMRTWTHRQSISTGIRILPTAAGGNGRDALSPGMRACFATSFRQWVVGVGRSNSPLKRRPKVGRVQSRPRGAVLETRCTNPS